MLIKLRKPLSMIIYNEIHMSINDKFYIRKKKSNLSCVKGQLKFTQPILIIIIYFVVSGNNL